MANHLSITVFFHSTHGDDGGIGRIVEAGCFRCERIECRHSVHQKQVTMMSAYLIHVTRRVIVCLWCPAAPGRQRWNCRRSVNMNGRPKSQELACRNSARMLYSISKVLGYFRSDVLLHFWPGQCTCGACVHRGPCHFQAARTDDGFPANTVSKGLRTLKLSVWR